MEVKVRQLKEQIQFYTQEMKRLIEMLQMPEHIQLISYFTTSFNISYIAEQESLCLGSYHIQNIGNRPIMNPHFCLKLPPNSPFTFSGRYVYQHFAPNLKGQSSWERTNDAANNEEYWLKPIGKPILAVGETLTFSQFQIKWLHDLPYSGSITGVTYCDELPEGVAVLNPINLNGVKEESHA
ncbi:hypothetical protein [Lysinibacillus piscis]|uniref:Uncharacterized protein n=1 Tax=Lysinibacillus piscis TaxID=2518931 RepID=A0ABQ5NMD8_9BACI|nr:hypothetical protein [Lysinibacillus sp. KH24]GLC89515.1 hypothetical protein LYSBPC_26420 [Lysinibacillus sp. KH24]